MADYPDWLVEPLGGRTSGSALSIAQLADARTIGRGGFSLSSPAFQAGGALDPCFTADEEDAVAPPLEWTAPPPGAQELVILVEDMDSKGKDTSCHWLVWGLAGQRGKLLEGEAPPRVGKNAVGNSEWLLPQPPEDDTAHSYVFQMFATDLPMTLMPGASREDVVSAIRGHVTAAAVLVGTYARQKDDAGEWDQEDEFD